MQKLILFVSSTFAVVGLGMLVGALLVFRSTSTFIEASVEVEGTVLDLVQRRSNDGIVYAPLVSFSTLEGKRIEFVPPGHHASPAASRGEQVTVLYPPGTPERAEIATFSSLWAPTMVLGFLGAIFFGLGGGILLAGLLRGRKRRGLLATGTRVQASYKGVELNLGLSVNGRHPFRVLAQWHDTATSRVHLFTSDNLWFDPSEFMTGDTITVFIEPRNPSNYHVDLSFLPRAA